MECGERSGFLFAHKCDRPATRVCGLCQKSICEEHSRVHEEEGVTQFLCISCLKQRVEANPENQLWRDRYGDDPYFYSTYHYPHYGYYDSRDRAVFESKADGADKGRAETDFEGS